MLYNPAKKQRRSIRLKGYDYGQSGFYFITICTKDMKYIFGNIKDGKMFLNQYGKIAHDTWLETMKIRSNVQLHAFIIMPNHMHGVIEINDRRGECDSIKMSGRGELHSPKCDSIKMSGTGECDSPKCDSINKQGECNSPLRSPSNNIGAIVRGYKSSVTKQIKLMGNRIDCVWQRNYYEHIIRDERAYETITNYINNNPKKWNADKFYRTGE